MNIKIDSDNIFLDNKSFISKCLYFIFKIFFTFFFFVIILLTAFFFITKTFLVFLTAFLALSRAEGFFLTFAFTFLIAIILVYSAK